MASDSLEQEKYIGSQDKTLFYVEGETDKFFLENLLNKYSLSKDNWENHWKIADAGDKRRVLKKLKNNPKSFGLVDKDEWDKKIIEDYKKQYGNKLFILPRYCVENYLINPKEIWQAISQKNMTQVQFEQQIKAKLNEYLRHGVLWITITPLWSELRELGFIGELASKNSVKIAQNNTEIQEKLQEWQDFLEPNQIFKKFQENLALAKQSSDDEQLAQWIHGKVFWEQVVAKTISQLKKEQISYNDMRKSMLQKMPIPDDMLPILEIFKPKP